MSEFLKEVERVVNNYQLSDEDKVDVIRTLVEQERFAKVRMQMAMDMADNLGELIAPCSE